MRFQPTTTLLSLLPLVPGALAVADPRPDCTGSLGKITPVELPNTFLPVQVDGYAATKADGSPGLELFGVRFHQADAARDFFSAIDLRECLGFEDDDLVWEKGGHFEKSCRQCEFDPAGSDDVPSFVCTCTGKDGEEVTASIPAFQYDADASDVEFGHKLEIDALANQLVCFAGLVRGTQEPLDDAEASLARRQSISVGSLGVINYLSPTYYTSHGWKVTGFSLVVSPGSKVVDKVGLRSQRADGTGPIYFSAIDLKSCLAWNDDGFYFHPDGNYEDACRSCIMDHNYQGNGPTIKCNCKRTDKSLVFARVSMFTAGSNEDFGLDDGQLSCFHHQIMGTQEVLRA